MTLAEKLMTADDLLRLPPNGLRSELVKGELITMSPTNGEHGSCAFSITVLLGAYIKAHSLGQGFAAETGFVIGRNPDTVRAPDFAFVANARLQKQGLTGKFYPEAPDLAVEVLSP